MKGLRSEPLASSHDRSSFQCGVAALDDYLVRQASQDVRRRVAAVFVMVRDELPNRVIGYYTLSSFAIQTIDLPLELTAKLPRYPTTPATLIGRLARATGERGLGGLLLADALKRIFASTREVASALVVVDAKGAAAIEFYRKHGFISFKHTPQKLFLPMQTIAAAGR